MSSLPVSCVHESAAMASSILVFKLLILWLTLHSSTAFAKHFCGAVLIICFNKTRHLQELRHIPRLKPYENATFLLTHFGTTNEKQSAKLPGYCARWGTSWRHPPKTSLPFGTTDSRASWLSCKIGIRKNNYRKPNFLGIAFSFTKR